MCLQMVEQPRCCREPCVCQPGGGQQGSGVNSRGQVRAVDSHAGSRPLPRSVRFATVLVFSFARLVPWLSSVGHTSSAVSQSTAGPLGVCVCSGVGGGGAG